MATPLDTFMAEDACGLIRLSTVDPHDPAFIWRPYLRMGNINDLRGNGGSCKTSLSLALSAAITKGIQPEGMPGRLNVDRSRTVIYLGTEDDLPEYRSMLDRQGANVDNVLMPSGHVPTLGEFSVIEKMIRRYDAALVIVDPVQALLPLGVDMNRANDIRPILDGLRDVARRTGCTVLLLEHLNKATKAANAYRGSGSMDFYNGSRSVLITGWTPEGRRACGHLKSNGAPYGPAILFDIDHTGRLIWQGGDPSLDGEDILTTRVQKAAPVPNPYQLLIDALPRPWEGTPSEAVALAPSFGISGATSPESFAKAVRATAGLKYSSRRTGRGTIYRLEAQDE